MANNRIRSQRKKFEHGNTHTQYDEETLKNSDLKVCRFVSKGGGHMKGLKTAQALKRKYNRITRPLKNGAILFCTKQN